VNAKRKLELFLLIVILAVSVFLRYVDPIFLSALPVTPDSVEYTTLSYNLLKGRGCHIVINDRAYPPRYPYGYPLLLVPFTAVFGPVLHRAVYASLFFGVAVVVLSYLLARSVFGPPEGLLAAFFVTVSPVCIIFSQVIVAVSATTALALLILLLSWRLLVKTEPDRLLLPWLGIGLLIGFNASVQLLSGLLFIPVALGIVLMRKRACLHALGGLVLGFAVAAAPIFLYFKLAYGSFFTTGYKYWVPEFYGRLSDSLSGGYLLENTRCSEDGMGTGNLIYYWRYLIGRGGIPAGNLCLPGFLPYLPWLRPYLPGFLPFAAVGIICLVIGIRKRITGYASYLVLFASTFASLGIFLLLYCFQMAKFLVLIAPLVIITGVYGITSSLRFLAAKGWRKKVAGTVMLLLIVPLALDVGHFIVTGRFLTKHPPFAREPFESVMAVNRVAENDAAIISSMDGVYVTHYAVSGTERTYIPMTRQAEYISKRDLPLIVAEEDPDAIERLLASGRPVYVDGFTARGWPRQMMLLSRRFDIKSAATYCNGKLHVYRLEIKEKIRK